MRGQNGVTRHLIASIALALALSLGSQATFADPLYTVVELLALPGQVKVHANAVNDSGQVVGYGLTPAPGAAFLIRPMFWDQGAAVALSGPNINALDINNSGQIVGISAVCDLCNVREGFGSITGQGGSGTWSTVAPGSSAQMPVAERLFFDGMLHAISDSGHMLSGNGFVDVPPRGLHSPNPGVSALNGLNILEFYESGVTLTSIGYLFDPIVDFFYDDQGNPIAANSHQWVLVPSCTGDVTGYAMSPGAFGVTSVPLPLQVSTQVSAGICDLAASSVLHNKLQNASGQFIVNVGDRAFLYTPASEPETLTLLCVGLLALRLRRHAVL